jgi:alkylated DNA repair protein alkB family protein 1
MHDGDILPALFKPKDPEAHKILGVKQVLDKKLRWVTLGGQYDWTNKVYPKEPPPQFPPDIASLINGIFPDMVPQAAIINLYSPGDTLSMHRDISEETDRGLVSISLGCDCIFIVGLENKSTGDIQYMVIRLRSGDVLYMTGESRLAWHGVPKVIPNTCPEFLTKCPAGEFPSLSGWIRNKRINLNVRQMRESAESFSDAVPRSVQDDGFSQSTSHS